MEKTRKCSRCERSVAPYNKNPHGLCGYCQSRLGPDRGSTTGLGAWLAHGKPRVSYEEPTVPQRALEASGKGSSGDAGEVPRSHTKDGKRKPYRKACPKCGRVMHPYGFGRHWAGPCPGKSNGSLQSGQAIGPTQGVKMFKMEKQKLPSVEDLPNGYLLACEVELSSRRIEARNALAMARELGVRA